MPLSVNSSFSTDNTLNQVQRRQEENSEEQASGRRINEAADDVAGLAIANRLREQGSGLEIQSQGAQDQINLNNTTSGQLSSISDSVFRAQELAVQSNNPLFRGSSAIQAEFDALADEINTVAGSALGNDEFISGLDASDPAATQAALEQALTTVNEEAARLGAESSGLERQINSFDVTRVNVEASRSRIEDTDFAQATAEQQQNAAIIQANISVQRDEQERRGLLVDELV